MELRELTVRKVPTGATVTVTCAGGKKKGCPFAKRTFKPSRGRATATGPFKGRKLRKGVTIEVRVTKRGAIGRVVTYRLTRAGRVPKARIRCLPAGSNGPAKSC